jgi:hypothetical protein
MIKHLSKYRSLIAAIFVLVPLLFWFTYSEIGQYTIEKQHPPAEDYCLVVRVIKTEISKTTANNLFKLNIVKSARINHIDETTLHIVSLNKTDSEHYFPPKENTQIYLYNRTFLI